MEPVLAGGELGVTEPNRPVPLVAVPNGELAALVVPKIDPPEAAAGALVVVTDPNRPVLALVTAAAVDPKMDVGLEVSAVTAPNAEVVPAELPPKIDVVSVFGVEKEALPKMFPEEVCDAAGLDGEQILNDPKRLEVASVVDVGAVVAAGADEVTEPNEKPEEVVAVVVVAVVTTAGNDVTAGAVDVTVDVTVVEAGVGAAVEVTEPNKGFASLDVGSADLTDRSVGLLAAAPNAKPLLPPPKENPVLADVLVAD